MKKKVFLILFFISLTVVVYVIYKNDKDTYLALGDIIAKGNGYSYNDYVVEHLKDNKHLNKYYKLLESDLRSNDLINLVEENHELEEGITIQQALVKANFVSLSIGSIDLYNHLIYGVDLLTTKEELNEYFLSMFKDLDKLLKLLRKYTPGKIIVIGFYNPQDKSELESIYTYIDKSYKKIAKRNTCEYISLKEISSNMDYLVEGTIYLNEKGHQYIGAKILQVLKQK